MLNDLDLSKTRLLIFVVADITSVLHLTQRCHLLNQYEPMYSGKAADTTCSC